MNDARGRKSTISNLPFLPTNGGERSMISSHSYYPSKRTSGENAQAVEEIQYWSSLQYEHINTMGKIYRRGTDEHTHSQILFYVVRGGFWRFHCGFRYLPSDILLFSRVFAHFLHISNCHMAPLRYPLLNCCDLRHSKQRDPGLKLSLHDCVSIVLFEGEP